MKKTILIVLLTIVSYQGSSGQYLIKYADVLEHYSHNDADSLKRKAALFLINNMEGHTSPCGTSLDKYAEKAMQLNIPCSRNVINDTWKLYKDAGNVSFVPDSTLTDSRTLIEHIDCAFADWHAAPWSDSIGFEQFCRYILPYKVKDERLCHEWRKVLREKYLPLIKDKTDMKEAFACIYRNIVDSIRQSIPSCPYTMDVLTIDHIRQASCEQRCVLLTSVLRSLAIPAAVDAVPLWANYSSAGHTWVSLVMRNGDTYTVYENEKEAKRYNKIDASRFPVRYVPEQTDSCPFDVASEKKVAKIYRIGYEHNRHDTQHILRSLSDPFVYDVSEKYGLSAGFSITTNATTPVYLCVFRSGNNWTPVAWTMPDENGKVTFSNIGNDIVYLVATVENRQLKAQAAPFLLGKDGITKFFNPDTSHTEAVTLYRKYPLFSYMTNQWGNMKGGVFEGASSPDFSDAEQLCRIERMPYGETRIKTDSEKPYRYLRYKTPQTSRTPLAELAFYSTDPSGRKFKLSGTPIAHKIEKNNMAAAFDGNIETVASTKSTEYWIGIDLGEDMAATVTEVVFTPKSDSNGIEPGHLYELYYYDKSWQPAGKCTAQTNHLVFNNIPAGALLLLKNRTKGKEERIFEYSHGRQIWY